MAEEKSSKKNVVQYKNFMELEEKIASLPQLLVYCSEDSFEYDLIGDLYRKYFSTSGESVEISVFVSEPGDLEKLFSELFNFSMFSKQKLILVKSGLELFKPILAAKSKALYDNFKKNFTNLSDKVYLVIHYNDKDVPEKFLSLFQQKYGLIKTKPFYPGERLGALEDVCKYEKVQLDSVAQDEFIHKVHPSIGSYIKNIRKLKLVLAKKSFTTEDVNDVLFSGSDFNPFHLTDQLFGNNISEFFKEYGKLEGSHDYEPNFLSVLNAFLVRADEIRKAKILFSRMKDSDDSKFFELLGISSYSEKRKAFMKNKLRKESQLFSDRALKYLYDVLVRMNIMFKSSPVRDEINFYFIRSMRELFLVLNERR